MSDTGNLRVTLYIVRHGECHGNKERTPKDPFTDFLTELGEEQAKLMGEFLQDVNFTRVYASDYPRTTQTAQIITDQNKSSSKVDVTPETRLRERDYTGLVGVEATEIISRMMAIMREGTPYLKVDLPDCETAQHLEDRLIKFLSELFQKLRNSTEKEEKLLFVSHGLTIQRLMVLLNSRSSEIGIKNWTRNLFSERLMKNTSCHKLIFDIPKGENSDITGYVDRAHYRDHVTSDQSTGNIIGGVKEEANDLEHDTPRTYEEETVHFCKPV